MNRTFFLFLNGEYIKENAISQWVCSIVNSLVPPLEWFDHEFIVLFLLLLNYFLYHNCWTSKKRDEIVGFGIHSQENKDSQPRESAQGSLYQQHWQLELLNPYGQVWWICFYNRLEKQMVRRHEAIDCKGSTGRDSYGAERWDFIKSWNSEVVERIKIRGRKSMNKVRLLLRTSSTWIMIILLYLLIAFDLYKVHIFFLLSRTYIL